MYTSSGSLDVGPTANGVVWDWLKMSKRKKNGSRMKLAILMERWNYPLRMRAEAKNNAKPEKMWWAQEPAGRKMPKIKRSSCKAEIKEIFGSCSREEKTHMILNMHETKKEEVFGVMSYNYMLLALYSLKSFFCARWALFLVRLILGLYLFFSRSTGNSLRTHDVAFVVANSWIRIAFRNVTFMLSLSAFDTLNCFHLVYYVALQTMWVWVWVCVYVFNIFFSPNHFQFTVDHCGLSPITIIRTDIV